MSTQVMDLSIENMRNALEGKEIVVPTEEAKIEAPASQEVVPDETDTGSGTVEEEKPSEEKKFAPKEKEDIPEGLQKRINKATWEKHEAQRKAQEAERKAEDLARKLAEKEQAPGKPEDKPATSFSEAEPQLSELDPDSFDTYQAYLTAQAKENAKFARESAAWETRRLRAEYEAQAVEQRKAQEQQEAAKTAATKHTELQKSWDTKVTEAVAANPKIAEAVNGDAGKFLTDAGMADRIMSSELGPEVVLYVQEHAEETMAVANTGDPLIVRDYISKIEGMLSLQKKVSTGNKLTAPREIPPPIVPVGGGQQPARGIDINDEKTSMADWSKEFRRLLTET